MRLLITLELPDYRLYPNARVHWAQKAIAVKRYRKAAGWAAMEAMQDAGLPREPKYIAAEVTATAYYLSGRNWRDPDNLAAALKPVWDGFQDSGLLKSDYRLRAMPPIRAIDRMRPRLEVEFVALEAKARRAES